MVSRHCHLSLCTIINGIYLDVTALFNVNLKRLKLSRAGPNWYGNILKSDFFYRPGDKRHKTQKSKFEIFCPEIAHGMLIHLVYFFCLKVLFFSRKKKSKSTLPLIIENGTKFKGYMGLQKRLIDVLLQNILDKFKS